MRDHQIAFACTFEHMALGIDDFGLDAEERTGCRTGLQGCRTGQRRDQNAAGFGLPPCIDNRAAAVADHFVIPFPCFGVDRFTDRAEQTQRGARGLFDGLFARTHQRTDRGGRGVEDRDLMLVHHIPEAADRGIGRNAFEHQRGRAIGQRAIDDIAVTGDPADIGRAPIDITLVIIEHILMRHRGIDQIAAGGVDHAFRLACRTRGVEQEQRIFRIHRLDGAIGRHFGHFLVIPDIAAGMHGDIAAGALDHDHGFQARGLVGSLIGIDFQGHLAATAQAFVGGDDHG